MKRFKVYQNKLNREDIRFIKKGFSWPALLFGIFWVLYKRMWWVAGAILLSYFLLLSFLGLFFPRDVIHSLADFVGLGLSLCLGVFGNEIYENYIREDFELVDVISAKNVNEAMIKFLASRYT